MELVLSKSCEYSEIILVTFPCFFANSLGNKLFGILREWSNPRDRAIGLSFSTASPVSGQTVSMDPPTLVTTVRIPHDWASRGDKGNPSFNDGKQKTSRDNYEYFNIIN